MSEDEDDKIELFRMTLIRNDDGTSLWVELKPEMAEFLRRIDETESRRERARKLREKTFTEMGIEAGQVGNPWQGPRMRFTWLIGESRTWEGEPLVPIGKGEAYCLICHGEQLPPHSYCLGCDHCGRELEIPGPGEIARGEAPREGDLRGGLQGKR